MSYASSDAFFFQGTLGDNLLYGLKHAPLQPPAANGPAGKRGMGCRRGAAVGQSGVGHPRRLDRLRSRRRDRPARSDHRHPAGARCDNLSQDIIDLALRSSIEPERHPELVERIVEVRSALRERLEHESLSSLVVPFEPGTYNPEATIGENLRFGTAKGPALADKALAANPYFMSVLKEVGLDETLYDMGLEIASNAIELFADLPPDNPLFQQLTFMTPEEIPDYQVLLQRLQGRKYADASTADGDQIITLSFAYIEPRHRFGLLTSELMDKIVDARNRIL